MENDVDKNAISKETLKSLAGANGINLPDERLERVLNQYKKYLELLARVDAYDLKREAEPETIFTLEPYAASRKAESRTAHSRTKGEQHGNR